MKNRNSPRKNEEFYVWLFRDDDLIAMARTLNTANRGMYIRTNSLLFPKYSKLHVVYDIHGHKPAKKIRATVVHRNIDGIGVVFDEHSADNDSVISPTTQD
jgi:hypothetical protein